MGISVRVSIVRGVAVLALDDADIVALSATARAALMDAIDEAEETDDARAIVLVHDGRGGPLGLSVVDSGLGLDVPSLSDLCARIEFCEKPVVVALDGTVNGAGMELALAAGFRVATRDLRLGFPEIALGLPPVAGATQKLPRLVGADLAARLLLDHRQTIAGDIDRAGLFDLVTDGPVADAALSLADHATMPEPVKNRRGGFADAVAYQRAIAKRKAMVSGRDDDAATRIVDLLEAAPLLPIDAGLVMEQDAFGACAASAASRGLVHLARSEFRLTVANRRDWTSEKPIAVTGGNALAVQIVAATLAAGLSVTWSAQDESRLARGQAALAELPGITPDHLARLQIGNRDGMTTGCDLEIVTARGIGGGSAAPHVIAEAAPGRFSGIGLRFAAPVRTTRIVEILEGSDRAEKDHSIVCAFVRRLGRIAVPVRSNGGCIAGRLGAALQRAADSLIDLGADPYSVDEALEGWGFAQGPFLSRDILGLRGFANVEKAGGARNWSAMMQEIDRTGRHAGAGFYVWNESDQASADRAVLGVLNGARPPRAFSPKTLCRLIVAALANEGARMLTAGMVSDAADIDVVSVHALHLSRHVGGVMHAAGEMGLLPLMKALDSVDHPDTALWTPDPLWADLIKNGRTFGSAHNA